MICRNCGQEIPESSMFCSNCGQAAGENSININNQQYSEQEYQQYNNEQYINQEYNQPYNNLTVINRIFQKINSTTLVLTIVIMLVILFLKSCFFGSDYKTPLDDMVKMINKRQTNIDKVADVVIPEILSDSYDEIIDVLKSNKEYKKDFKTFYKKDLPDAAEDLYDDFFDEMEDIYGKNPKISYEIKDKEKLDKEEKEAIAKIYSLFTKLSSGVTDCIEALEDCTELTEKDIKKLIKQVEALEKKLDKFKVSSGYLLNVKLTIKGKDKKDSEKMDIVVIKVNGEWMIDYISSIMINSENCDLDEVDELFDEDEIKKLNSKLKVMAKYMDQMDEDMIEEILDNWENLFNYIF